MAGTNSRIVFEKKGLVNPLNFAGAADNKARVALLNTAIKNEETDPTAADARLFLDEMTPIARASLSVMLDALEAAVTNT